jgi:hypothetical protein
MKRTSRPGSLRGAPRSQARNMIGTVRELESESLQPESSSRELRWQDVSTIEGALVLPSYTHFFLLNHPQMSSASSTICASASSLPQDQLSSGMLLKFIP